MAMKLSNPPPSRPRSARPLVLGLGLIVLALVIPLAVSLAVARTIAMNAVREQSRITTPRGIDWNGFVDINGTRQYMLIRGQDSTAPVILFLHGGPGSPETGMAQARYQGELERDFVMVHWEQRGACKSLAADPTGATMSFGQFVDDTRAAAEYLRARFAKPQLYVIGHSWGTMLGVEFITKYPEMVAAYIGVGQVVNTIEQERISREFCLECLGKRGRTRDLEKLRATGAPPYRETVASIVTERRYLGECGGWCGANYSYGRLFMDLATFPYYTLADAIAYAKGSEVSIRTMIGGEGFWKFAFDSTHTSFAVPVAFYAGRHDYNTPFELVERYFERVAAPQKQFVWFEESGHLVNFEEPARFQAEVARFFSQSVPTVPALSTHQ